MKKQKNELATLSPQQSDPGRAKPEDFAIIRDDDEAFHGQRSYEIQRASDAECSRKKFAGTPETPNVNDAGPAHSDGF